MQDHEASAVTFCRPCLAVVLAAGQGKRMKSRLPKPLHCVAGRPMLLHCLAAAEEAGAGRIAVVVPPAHDAFLEWLAKSGLIGQPDERAVLAAPAPKSGRDDPHGREHSTADESSTSRHGAANEPPRTALFVQAEQRGTAHAVLACRSVLEEVEGDVLVLYGDTPLIRAETLQALRAQLNSGAALAVLGFEAADPTGYGRLLRDGGRLLAIVEEKDATPEQRALTLCSSGVMAFRANVILSLLDGITDENASGEFYLTDAVARANALGLEVAYTIAADPEEVLGVNDREQLAAAEAAMQRRLRRAAMLGGATLIDPETVTFSYDTRLGQDVTVEPHVFFGPGVNVADGATIRAFSHLEGVSVAEGATLGPFARLRPETEIGARARIGNFVEIKAARVEPGAKVNHLSYIGDARVGADANIGAGTITCNYDGIAKHRTEIGAGAFIGSNSSLVAPVSIGDGAYVGSGSVISENVPPDTLVVTRAPRTAREGWPSRRRAKLAGPDHQK